MHSLVQRCGQDHYQGDWEKAKGPHDKIDKFAQIDKCKIQYSFIPRRQASDDIILAQEMPHSMRRKWGKDGWLVVKIDFEKSYDRINWSFFEKVLVAVGLEK